MRLCGHFKAPIEAVQPAGGIQAVVAPRPMHVRGERRMADGTGRRLRTSEQQQVLQRAAPDGTGLCAGAAGGELDERAAAAMGRDIERVMRDQAAREAARSDQKAVWRALALAGGGAASGVLRGWALRSAEACLPAAVPQVV